MVIRNLEVVDSNRRFEDLVLNLFDNDIFSVDKNQNFTGPKIYGILGNRLAFAMFLGSYSKMNFHSHSPLRLLSGGN
jgi:hypothetical protein